jgi:hypothetical protein
MYQLSESDIVRNGTQKNRKYSQNVHIIFIVSKLDHKYIESNKHNLDTFVPIVCTYDSSSRHTVNTVNGQSSSICL